MLTEGKYKVEGFLTIRDAVTREDLVVTCNAIHFGNLSAAMAEAMCGRDSGHIRYMAFGNGGTFINASSELVYKSTNTQVYKDKSSSLYNETFFKELDQTNGNTTVPVPTTTTYADIKVTCTLDATDTGDLQLSLDRNTTDTATTFDEIALYAGDPGLTVDSGNLMSTSNTLMLTHVIFHPIQKSLNRILEIDYTIRIHLE